MVDEFDTSNVCNRCGGNNDTEVRDVVGYTVCEEETTCEHCGFEDYWAYGHLQSSSVARYNNYTRVFYWLFFLMIRLLRFKNAITK